MHFTIITPSCNQLDYLKRCVASVRDQVAPEAQRSEISDQRSVSLTSDICPLNSGSGSSIHVHHHVQDGGSTDGAVDWLERYAQEVGGQGTEVRGRRSEGSIPNAYSFSFASEADEGMYDALNKGVAFALQKQVDECGLLNDKEKEPLNNEQLSSINPRDSVIAWLNCDEQYLPGTLQKVSDFFDANPEVDLLFGGMLMVDPQGKLLACRKAMPMRRLFLEASYLYNYSCAMFFRESLWKTLDGFDTAFKNAGDEDLLRRAMAQEIKTAVLKDYLAVFIYTDNNLSSGGKALEEHEMLKKRGSIVSQIFKLPINFVRLAEKFVRGGSIQKTPVIYVIYGADVVARIPFSADKPSCQWPDEHKPYLMSHRLK